MSSRHGASNYHFDIHASVVFQLGESLITDVVQALVELIKNSYDADASFANVMIDTTAQQEAGSTFPAALGCISIEDDGEGMDLERIQRGWLTISNSLKREAKSRKQTTNRGRTPLGDKGLGRLGAQRLGYNLEVFTRRSDSPVEYHVAFSWRAFLDEGSLYDVPVEITTQEPTRQRGTRLVISDLHDVDTWNEPRSVDRLQTSLSEMISPYQEVQDFVVAVTVDGTRLELAAITQEVRRAAEVRYLLDFDGNVLRVTGRVRLDFFRPPKKAERPAFQQLVERNDGQEFLSFLARQKQAKDLNLRGCSEPGWFIEFSYTPALADVTPLALVDGRAANPGPFHAEVDSFDLGEQGTELQSVFDRAADYRRYVTSLSGIRVYRDGFGIRVDRDWLKLGAQWTSARSYYGLKPQNTLGFVALSARDNAQLEETTDREGFKSTPYYRNFYGLLQLFVGHTERAHEFLRRGWIDFRNRHAEQLAGVASETSSEQILGDIGRRLAHTLASGSALASVSTALDAAVRDTQGAIKTIDPQMPDAAAELGQRRVAIGSLEHATDAARPVLEQVQELRGELAHLQANIEVLVNREALQREQLLQIYEAISLGLTAEALSHEIKNVTDQLAQRSQQFRSYLRQHEVNDRRISAYAEHVQSSTAALRRQLAHLAPSLRYVRERRERINLPGFLQDNADFYRTRWADRFIDFTVAGADAGEFVLFMNRGKLVQIFDNLVLNSEYWLREDIRLGRIARGCVTVQLADPMVRVFDNSRGIDLSVESSLFEPFVTTKPQGHGRGLGLFIVRQLLDAEGCTIDVLPDRNANNRLYMFQINFSGALDGRR